eukprot:2397796-Amphidinium_carterae.1
MGFIAGGYPLSDEVDVRKVSKELRTPSRSRVEPPHATAEAEAEPPVQGIAEGEAEVDRGSRPAQPTLDPKMVTRHTRTFGYLETRQGVLLANERRICTKGSGITGRKQKGR